jgi:hypothetical protein
MQPLVKFLVREMWRERKQWQKSIHLYTVQSQKIVSGVAPAGTTTSEIWQKQFTPKELVKLSVENSALFIRTRLYAKFGSF